ncbi:hypothetical protein GGX14DRAFT_313247, partial [Mycena pura]
TAFENLRDAQRLAELPPWDPFDSEKEWGLGKWLAESGVSQARINQFLKLDIIKENIQPSFHNARALYQKIDTLPTGPRWNCEVLEITGDELDHLGKSKTEKVHFWQRDCVEAIKTIIANPTFKDHLRYAPEQVYLDEECTKREYEEMWTGDTWWELQVQRHCSSRLQSSNSAQGKLPVGATVVPVILASDKTQLSTFSGDKQAWPVYLSVGNLSKDIRRKPSLHGTILIGYIPVSK